MRTAAPATAREAGWKPAIVALVLALTASAVLAFAPTGTSMEAVQVIRAGAPAPEPAQARISRTSLLQVQGSSVLVPLGIPVFICATALAVRRRWAFVTAMILLSIFSFLGALSIGFFYLPAAVAMAFAAGRSLERVTI